jgi:hypothetical protein
MDSEPYLSHVASEVLRGNSSLGWASALRSESLIFWHFQSRFRNGHWRDWNLSTNPSFYRLWD